MMPSKTKPAGRRMSVITKRDHTVFHRAGIEFCWQPVRVREHLDDGPDTFDPIGLVAEVCQLTFDRIVAEPMLVCTILEGN